MKYLFILSFIVSIVAGLALQPKGTKIDSLVVEIRREYKKQTIVLGLIVKKQREGSSLSWDEFKVLAERLARENDIPPSVLIAQATLETGRGTSAYATERNNYFGFNAVDWNPDLATTYGTAERSIMDYISLMKNNPRYAVAYAHRDDPYRMITEIKRAGYATDPYYVSKITSLPEFQEYLP